MIPRIQRALGHCVARVKASFLADDRGATVGISPFSSKSLRKWQHDTQLRLCDDYYHLEIHFLPTATSGQEVGHVTEPGQSVQPLAAVTSPGWACDLSLCNQETGNFLHDVSSLCAYSMGAGGPPATPKGKSVTQQSSKMSWSPLAGASLSAQYSTSPPCLLCPTSFSALLL